jgi:outer membrane protein assembly factor BamB
MKGCETVKRRTYFRGVFAGLCGIIGVSAVFILLPQGRGRSQSTSSSLATLGGNVERNNVNLTDKNIPATWAVAEGKRQNIKWVAKLSNKAYGGPVVADGRVYVATDNREAHVPAITGDKGIVLCFRDSDGNFLWEAAHDALPVEIAKEARSEGIASTPTIEGNRLYYVSNRCELICSSTEGRPGTPEENIIWRLDMIKDLNVFPHKLPNGSPLLVGDTLFVSTGNGADGEGAEARPPHPEAPSLIAVNKNTGKVIWQDNSPGDHIILGQWSNPAYAVVRGKPQVIFGGGDGWLRAFEPDTGKPIWKFNCNPAGAKADQRNYIVATPVVANERVYIGVGQEPSQGTGVGHLWCVNPSGSGDISPRDDDFDPHAPVNNATGLVWHYGGAVKGGGDRDVVFGRTLSTCVVQGGLLYAAELAGYLHCLDAATGQKYWDHDLKAEIWGSPYWVDGKIYIGTADGDIHVFAHGKEKKVLAKNEMEDPIYSTPTASDGVLYVATMRNLFAISAR